MKEARPVPQRSLFGISTESASNFASTRLTRSRSFARYIIQTVPANPPRMASNLSVLTKSHQIIASKKRQRKQQIKEITEFLTGFHKRKLAKTEEGKKKAIERDKQERLETRREQRKMLAEQAIENAAKVEKAYGAVIAGSDDDDEEWTGFGSDAKGKGKDEAEYSDEEQVATVTVVEDFDPDTLIHGEAPIPRSPSAGDVEPRQRAIKSEKPLKKVEKLKPKKIKYQTKAARKAETGKQRARRTEKAERAGGKASREKGKKGRKR
ncbi:hypothetical protein EWM64_g5364 [Hericium alpestre]|uniref:Ribosomal RNA-processing protein 17 n=1 Tax=Hericium alpestre TaxID=135208 RepID=A0A4Y9ZUT4_9AGAM|nr:hypothetical protein EWM64_g5364 [Hericium alpestre]